MTITAPNGTRQDRPVVIEDRAQTVPWNVIGDLVTPIFTTADGTAFELFELTGAADSGPPPHQHPWDEAYVILDGSVSVAAGDMERTLGPGGVVQVPAGVMHTFTIVSPQARFLVLTSPQGASAFFADVAANVGPLPDSLPSLVTVAKRNGLSSPIFPD